MTSESSITSCSDCKLELIERRWTQLLLNWLNKCVHPKTPVMKLNNKSLVEVMCKYKQDICDDEIQQSILDSADVEPFIKYNYPLLKLKYLYDEEDNNKKLYIMTAVLMYHCCINSVDGKVDSDICAHLNRMDQEMILKYCEGLMDMEVTVNNVDSAIRDACDAMKLVKVKTKPKVKMVPDRSFSLGSGESCQPIESATKPSVSWSLSKLSTSSTSEVLKRKKIRFDTSVTVLPSALTETSSYTDNEYVINYDSVMDASMVPKEFKTCITQSSLEGTTLNDFMAQSNSCDFRADCLPGCACLDCHPSGPTCAELGRAIDECCTEKKNDKNYLRKCLSWKVYLLILILLIMIILITIIIWIAPWTEHTRERSYKRGPTKGRKTASRRHYADSINYVCRNNVCQTSYTRTSGKSYQSMSRCILKCMGPQLWPHPIGFTFYNKKIVALATSKLEYKFQSVPSESVHSYLAQAFKLFIEDLVQLEKINMEFKDRNATQNLPVRKMNIQLNVESDPDPRVRVDTDETYNLKVDVVNNVLTITITSPSFCGVRHGLETLSQLILTDPSSGCLITLSNVVIKDAPSYKYRGLMIDTGRNYIPVTDLIRTIDAMATCKLNTFHWRISDVTSFPLMLPSLPQLFDYGGYDRSLVYSKTDVKTIVKRAGIRGIRVLIEVAAPGPVGRPWSWSPDASCPSKATNYSCNNYLCLRLAMREPVMDVLETIYSEIIEMTKVEDIFHLSDSLFSMVNCYYLTEDRRGFLDIALAKLKLANKGYLPKLPIIWYTKHLSEGIEAKCWDRLGVQLTEWQLNPSDRYLSRFKVIHSSRWDLSCEIKKHRCIKYRTWQNMYSWNSWRNIDVFTTEGGESILWTDLVDSANLDIHLWPRAAAVAERLWSDIAINSSVYPSVYIRLDNYRWRLMRKSVKVQPIWPMYCNSNPEICLKQLRPQK